MNERDQKPKPSSTPTSTLDVHPVPSSSGSLSSAPSSGPSPNPSPEPEGKPKSDRDLRVIGEGRGGGDGSHIPAESVGYKRPPRQHRFQKGKSGNPKGRPKGKRSRKSIAERVLLDRRAIDIDGRPRALTMVELVILALRQEAMRGKASAFKTYRSVEGRYGPQESKSGAGYLVIPYVETIEQWMALWGPDGMGGKQPPSEP